MATKRSRPPVLGPGAVKKIHEAVEAVYSRAKARFLGPWSVPKRIYVTYNHQLSLPGLYEAAAKEEGAVASEETLNQLLKVAGGYLDAQKERVKAKAVKEVQAFLTDAHFKGRPADPATVLQGQLTKVWGEARDGFRKIVEAEANQAKNMGTLDAIVKVNAVSGVEDPVVYFVVVRDKDLCEECRKIHLLPDGVTPRVWKLSEIGHGYHKRGDDSPKIGGLHPNCRCTMVTLLPSYGFSKAGMVSFVKTGHDEWARQRA